MKRVLIVEGTNKVIKDREYESQNIEILILKEGIVKIGKKAFFNNDIKKLFLPKSLEEIDYDSIDGNNIEELIIYSNFTDFKAINPSDILYERNHLFPIINYRFLKVKTLTIIDADYNYLKLFFNNYVNLFYKDCLNKIIVINPKLSLIEKIAIKKLCKSKNITVEFSDNSYLDNFLNTDNLIDNQDEDQVNKLINKIFNMINSLDEESKEIIINKIDSLIIEYQQKLNSSKPQFDFNQSLDLSVEDTSPKALKDNLIISLEIIVQNINIKSKIINFSKKINLYNQFLLGNDVEIKDDQNFDKIKKIVKLAKLLDKSECITELNRLFDQFKEFMSCCLKEDIINLTLENEDIEKNFNKKLDIIYNQIIILNNQLIQYYLLLNSLRGFQNDLELSSELRQLENVFSNLIGKTNTELTDLYKEIKNKYINIINETVNKLKKGEEVVSASEIEMNFRKELQTVLLMLKKELPDMLKIKKLYYQLSMTTENKKGIIIDLIKEIKELMNSDLLNSSIKDMIIDKLSRVMIHWQFIFDTEKIDDIIKNYDSNVGLISKDLIIEFMIMNDLYEIKLNLEEYLNKLQEHNKYTTDANLFHHKMKLID